MSAARKPKAKASPGPKPAADHGQDPAAAGARQQTTDTKTEAADTSNSQQTQQQSTPAADNSDTDAKPTERVSLLLTPDDAKALKAARVEDGIDANKRLRAMISLWREDQRHRTRVDKRAKQYRR